MARSTGVATLKLSALLNYPGIGTDLASGSLTFNVL